MANIMGEHTTTGSAVAPAEARDAHRPTASMSTCLRAQILWGADNAERFGELCRRTLGLCEEGEQCPPSAAGWILLVSSERGVTSAGPPVDPPIV